MKNLIIVITIMISITWAHEHNDSEKGQLLGAYEDLLQSINVSSAQTETNKEQALHMVKINVGKKSFSIPETILADVAKQQLLAYEETIREYCECDISALQKENRKRLPWIMEKIKNTLTLKLARDFAHIISDMLWTEVSGAKRYGIVYIVVSTIGEIIDHNISPVPLCKLIAFASRALSDKVKTAGTLLWPFDSQIGATTKMKALFSRIYYRRKFRKKWLAQLETAATNFDQTQSSKTKFTDKIKTKMRKLEIGYVGLNKFPKDFSSEITPINIHIEVKQAMTTLDPMQRMWYTDRLMEYFNFTYLLLLENGKILKSEHGINKRNYFKIQWDIGGYGSKIDELKILLYAASATENDKRKEKLLTLINSKVDHLLSEFKSYQELFYDIDHNWNPTSKLKFKKDQKVKYEKAPTKCMTMLSRVFSKKTAIWATVAGVTYSILTEDFESSESM